MKLAKISKNFGSVITKLRSWMVCKIANASLCYSSAITRSKAGTKWPNWPPFLRSSQSSCLAIQFIRIAVPMRLCLCSCAECPSLSKSTVEWSRRIFENLQRRCLRRRKKRKRKRKKRKKRKPELIQFNRKYKFILTFNS